MVFGVRDALEISSASSAVPLTALRPSAHRTQRTHGMGDVDNVRLGPPISGKMAISPRPFPLEWAIPHFRFFAAESDLPFLRAAVARPDPAVLCRAMRHRKRMRPPTEFTAILCVDKSRLARRRAAGNGRHLRAVRCASARRRYPRRSWLIISARLSVPPSACTSVCCEPALAMPAIRLSSAGADAHARYMRFRALNSFSKLTVLRLHRRSADRRGCKRHPAKVEELTGRHSHSRSVSQWHLSAACAASRCQRRAVRTARA